MIYVTEDFQKEAQNTPGLDTKELVVMSFLSAILFAGQIALAPIPNIEIVSVLIYIYSQIYRKKVFFIIYVFVLLEGCMYGFGLWWLGYLYVWSILAVIVLLMNRNQTQKSLFSCSMILGAYGLSFGFLYAIPYFVVSGREAGFAYWIAGIPFDLLHCLGNVAVAFTLYKPLYFLLNLLSHGNFFHRQ